MKQYGIPEFKNDKKYMWLNYIRYLISKPFIYFK